MPHLTQEQRYTISTMLNQGYSQKSIADTIGKHKSIISRELKRNSDQRSGQYRSELAIRKTQKRHSEKLKHVVFTKQVKEEIETLLKQDYSPEQVVGLLKKQGKFTVSHERIYQHIWEDKRLGGTLYTHLRCQGRRYRKRGASKDKRGRIKNQKSIDLRPKIVDQKKRFGDLEVDLVIGKNHKYPLLTINDRASGMLKTKKLGSKNAEEVAKAIIDLLQDWSPYIHTITSDNGKEFAEHQKVSEALGVDFYFAHPYHSWERGANENLNGLIRQYLPKKTAFENVSNQRIQEIEDKINKRPRKRYGFENPIFVMNQLLFNQKVAFMT